MEEIKKGRKFLKSTWLKIKEMITDQKRGIPQPPLEKPYEKNAVVVDLISSDKFTVGDAPLKEVIAKRRSRRKFTDKPLTLEELSFLLWSTQGVKEVRGNRATFRTVPSAGARHPFETYLAIHNVEDIKPGLYRYLALEHKLLFLKEIKELPRKLIEASLDQRFVGECAVTFI